MGPTGSEAGTLARHNRVYRWKLVDERWDQGPRPLLELLSQAAPWAVQAPEATTLNWAFCSLLLKILRLTRSWGKRRSQPQGERESHGWKKSLSLSIQKDYFAGRHEAYGRSHSYCKCRFNQNLIARFANGGCSPLSGEKQIPGDYVGPEDLTSSKLHLGWISDWTILSTLRSGHFNHVLWFLELHHPFWGWRQV